MSIELEPAELGFRRPFTTEVSQILRLRNPHEDSAVAFKVKTTAPKQYCVRPNSGSIRPGGLVEVQVLLQAMKEDPPLDARCRDKFLVQSVALGDDADLGNVSGVWSNMEKQGKDAIKEKKIRVTFLPAHGTAEKSSAAMNGVSHNAPEDAPPAYRSPSPPDSTPQTAVDSKSFTTPLKDSAPVAAVSGMAASAATSVSKTASSASDTMAQQLEAAKKQIADLTTQLQDSGFRQRKTETVIKDAREKATSVTSAMGMQNKPAEGVPVQIAAALCLLSFLLAYFFF